MLNLQQLMIDPFVENLKKNYSMMFGSSQDDFGEILGWAGNLILENLSNADALYHNVEHTLMVTVAGQEILKGKHLIEGGVKPSDWLHYVLALMCHDIGLLPGICNGDTLDTFVINSEGEKKSFKIDGTCAVFTPYHVDRGKIFVLERFASNKHIDAERLASYIEMTRFPVPQGEFYRETRELRGLVRAADFIGQLGDPGYLRKLPALFYEFEEINANEKFGYKTPEDLRQNYAKFYWEIVRPYIKDALHYLRVTHDGRQWVANLHSHVFDAEHKETRVLTRPPF